MTSGRRKLGPHSLSPSWRNAARTPVVSAIGRLHGQSSIAALGGRTFLWFAITATLAVVLGTMAGFVLSRLGPFRGKMILSGENRIEIPNGSEIGLISYVSGG